MVFQPAPNCAEVVIRQFIGTEPFVQILNFEYATPPTEAQLATLCETLWEAADESNWHTLMGANWFISSIEAKGLSVENDVFASYSETPISGDAAGTQLPNNVAFCIKLTSAFTGRSARGRTYFGGFTSAYISGAYLNSTGAGYLKSVVEVLQAAALSEGATLIILSRVTNKAPRAEAVPFVVTNIGWTDLVTDSQRGRLPNH